MGGAEDAQAQVSAYHKLFRRSADLLRCKQSARRAVNPTADLFLIRSNGRTGKYASAMQRQRVSTELCETYPMPSYGC